MGRRLDLAVVLTLLLSLLLAGAVAAQEHVHWSYEGKEGPEHWGELSPDFALCAAGVEQSPVDIPASAAVNPADLVFNYQPSALKIQNNGHTIQVDYDPGSTLEVDGVPYELWQFHFHGPSEHTLNGEFSPMEMHLVHRSAEGGLVVVGVMIEGGDENEALAPVWGNLPAEEMEAETIPGASVDANALLPAERSYYRYNGSLTTPPCTEGVKWLVMSTPIELSGDQIAAFEEIIHANYRPVQPLNEREFLLSSEAGAAPEVLPTSGADLAGLAPIGLIIVGVISLGLGATGYAVRRRRTTA